MDLSLSLLVLTAAGLVLAYRGVVKASCPGAPRRFTGTSGAMLGIGVAAAGLGLGGMLLLHGPWGPGGMHGHGMGPGRGMGGMMGIPSGPGATVSPADLAEPAEPGARLFVRYCATCHALPSPALHAPAEWPAVVARMGRNMAAVGRPGPAPSEARAIAEYLARQAPHGMAEDGRAGDGPQSGP